jgi:hypothetical protein
MHAQAETEAVRAELESLQASLTGEDSTDQGRVVYERPSEVADYEFAVATLSESEYAEGLSEAI